MTEPKFISVFLPGLFFKLEIPEQDRSDINGFYQKNSESKKFIEFKEFVESVAKRPGAIVEKVDGQIVTVRIPGRAPSLVDWLNDFQS